MNLPSGTAAATALLLFAAPAVHAQDQQPAQQQQPQQTLQQEQAAAATPYTEIDDIGVFTAEGNRVGEIEDVVADQNGNLAFVVEIEEGFLGMREREVIVPMDRLTYDREAKRFNTEMAEADFQTLQVWDD